LLPSDRVIVPKSDMFTPPEAVGVALAITGGQALAHAPEQLDVPFLSATHRYSARPELPTRYVPSGPFTAPIERLAAGALDAAPEACEELAAGALGLEDELLLPHAATHTATPIIATKLPMRAIAALDLSICHSNSLVHA
jgi:hypothetical protein